jgi:hypothetical protein
VLCNLSCLVFCSARSTPPPSPPPNGQGRSVLRSSPQHGGVILSESEESEAEDLKNKIKSRPSASDSSLSLRMTPHEMGKKTELIGPAPKWEGGLYPLHSLTPGTKNPKKTRNRAPLPFGGGDGGGVERAGRNTNKLKLHHTQKPSNLHPSKPIFTNRTLYESNPSYAPSYRSLPKTEPGLFYPFSLSFPEPRPFVCPICPRVRTRRRRGGKAQGFRRGDSALRRCAGEKKTKTPT